jgi:hypothetical protein
MSRRYHTTQNTTARVGNNVIETRRAFFRYVFMDRLPDLAVPDFDRSSIHKEHKRTIRLESHAAHSVAFVAHLGVAGRRIVAMHPAALNISPVEDFLIRVPHGTFPKFTMMVYEQFCEHNISS